MTIAGILALADGPVKTAALVAWVQNLFPQGSEPVLVGGAAVELYTRGAYVTGDLDFVGRVPAQVGRALVNAGFAKQGRHWVHERGQLFIEFPGESLREGEKAVRLRFGKRSVWTISQEDALADRLGAWEHWGSMVDGVNAWLLYRARRRSLDRKRLRARAAAVGAEGALRALFALARRLEKRKPREGEVERWAQEGP
jgi:hypothetical protein